MLIHNGQYIICSKERNNNLAKKVAISTVVSFLKEGVTSIKEVVFVLFDSATFESYSSVDFGIIKGSQF